MNRKITSRVLSLAIALVVGLIGGRAGGETYYYDSDGTNAGFGTAGGTWSAPTPGPIPGWTTDGTGVAVPGSVTTATGDTLNFGNDGTGLGAGTITVSGTVDAGNMTFAGGSGAIVLSGGTITLAAAETITVNNSADTISSILAGAATSLTKAGTGTLTLTGDNGYSGTTVISGGILAIAHNNALGATSGNTTIAATGSNTGPQLSLSGGITSAENITLTGKSEQNQYNAAIYNTSGINTLSGNITLASPTGSIRLSSGGGELIFSGTISQTGTSPSLVLQAANGAALTVNTAIANNNGGLLVLSSGVVTLKGASTAIGATSIIEGGYLKLGVNNAIKTDQDLKIGEAWNYTPSDQGTFDLAGFNQTVKALIGNKNTLAGTIGADSTRIVINSVTGTSTLTVGNGNGTGTFNGVIQDGGVGKIVALTKTGTGTLTLVGDSNYSGVTTISAGTIAITHANALGSTAGNTTIAATGSNTGGVLQLSGGITTAENITITGTTEAGSYFGAIRSISGNNIVSGNITLASPGTNGIRLEANGGNLTFSGSITQTGTTRSLILEAESSRTLTVDNAIANNGGSLLTDQPGTVILKGVSGSGIGDAFMFGGTLKLGVTDALNTTRPLELYTDGSPAPTFDLAGFNQTINTLRSGGTGATANRKVINTVAGTSTLTVGNGGGSGTFNGQINTGTGNIQLIKTGAGNQTLSGNNSFTGGTRIDAGTLTLGHATDTLAGGGAVNVNGGTLALGSNSDTVGAVTLTSGNITGSGGTLTGTGSAYDVRSGSVSAKLGGSVGLTKSTAGTVALSGVNSYTGNTAVNDGTLLVNGSITGTVNVASGAYLGGTGAITGNVTYASGAFGLFTNDAPLRFTGPVTLNGNTAYLTLPDNLPVGNYVLATNTTGQFSGAFATTPAISSGSFVSGSAQAVTTTGDSVVLQVTVLAVASKLAITDVNSGGNPTAGVPYSVTVQAQDAGGGAQNVTGDTGITLSRFSGTAGSLGGTLTGTILSGQDSVIIPGVTNSVAEVFTLQAATNSGMSLTAGTYSYTVNPASAATLSVAGFPSPVALGASHNVTVTALDAYGNTDTNYAGTVTLASTLGGASFLPASPYTFLAGDAGVKTFSAALNTLGQQDLTASGTGPGSPGGQQSGIEVMGPPTGFFWTNTVGGAWDMAGNWTNATTVAVPPVADGQADYVLDFSRAGAYSATNNLNGGFLLNQLNFGGATVTLKGNSLTLTNDGAVLPQVSQNGSVGVVVSNDIALAANTTIGGAGSGALTLAGALSGAVSLTKTNTGTLTLAAANTYSGGTSLDAGVLSFSNGALGTTGNITMNGGTLQWAGGNVQDISSRLVMIDSTSASFDTGANNVTLAMGFGGGSSGSIVKLGSGQLSLSGATTYTGATIINAGTLNVSGQGTTPLSSSSGVTFTGNSTFIYLFASILPAMTVHSGVTAQVNNAPTGANTGSTMPSLSGGGTFSADNPGGTGQGKGITFGDLSSFTGVLQVQNTGASFFFSTPNLNDAVASNIRVLGNGTTIPVRFIYTGNAGLTLNNRAFEMGGWAGCNLTINNTGTGTFTINKDLLVTAAGNKTLQLGGSNTGNNTFAGAISNGVGAVISLTKADAGKWILSGTNTYTGATTISGGTLEIGGAGVLGGGAYAGNIANSATLLYGSSADQNLSGVISGAGALLKSGAGALTLAGANTYTNTTTINAGTLRLGADNTLDADNRVVLAGGELDMGGSSNSLGTLAVTGPGTIVLGAGSLSFQDSSGVAWTGELTLEGTLVPRTVRFGTSAAALTGAQLASITNARYPVGIDADGYLFSLKPGGVIMIIR